MPGKETTRKPPAAAGGSAAEARAMAFAIEAARHLSDDKCVDVLVLDVRALSQVTDFIVIGTGTSDRRQRLLHTTPQGRDLAPGHPLRDSMPPNVWPDEIAAEAVDQLAHACMCAATTSRAWLRALRPALRESFQSPL